MRAITMLKKDIRKKHLKKPYRKDKRSKTKKHQDE